MSAFALYLYASYDSITEGIVEESNYEYIKIRVGSVERYNIVYSYNVKGDIFYSNRVNLSDKTNDTDRTVEKYPKGEVVKVFYDPKNPRYAILENDGIGFDVCFQVFIVFCVLFGGVGMNIYLYHKKQKRILKAFSKLSIQ